MRSRYALAGCLALLVRQTTRIGSADPINVDIITPADSLAHSQPVELHVE